MIKFTAIPITLDAAAGDSTAPRTITGIAVPWDVVATVSGGEKVMFKRGAFDLNAKPARLLENHDGRPIGIVNEIIDLENGLGFTASFARSQQADSVVELIQMSAYDSVSVGAVPRKFKYDKNGVMIVSSADLQELSVVSVPAFADAVIEQIAASEPDPEEVEEEANEPQPDTSLQEETMSQETQVEASTPDVIPTTIFAAARREFKLPSPAEYISSYLRGGHEFAQMHENIRAAAPDVITTDTPGILPTPILSPVYNNFRGLRPVVDAIGAKAMPGGGKIFIRPEVTTHTSMAVQSAENAAVQSGTFVVYNNQVTKNTYGGYVTISEQDLDWTDPAVLSLVLDDMGRIYANQTDDVAADALVAGATTTAVLSDANLLLADKVVAFVYDAAATILSASNGNLPTHLFVASDVFASLGKLSDTALRPLFPQTGPMNAYGSMSPASTESVAFGLRVVVDRNFAAKTMIVGDASGFEIFEQQKGAISIDNPSTLSRTIAFRGYFATLMIDQTKFVKRVTA
jgi:HK97 family phage prohead protease